MIKVSVIIPIYNSELYLKKCLDSLINQTLKDIEFILINDCSTDRSGEICEEYAKKDDRVVVIHNKKNIKQGLSRNKGLELAKGEYVGFVDPDDWVDLNFYEKLYYSAKQNNSDIAKAELKNIFTKNDTSETSLLNEAINKGMKRGEPLFTLFSYEHTTAIYSRIMLLENNVTYPDIRNGQDIAFLTKAVICAKSISLVPEVYYCYRKHKNSITAKRTEIYYENLLKTYKTQINFLNSCELNKEHYCLGFLNLTQMPILKYQEIEKQGNLFEYRKDFLKQFLPILSEYKYLDANLLISFIKKELIIQQLKGSWSYRIGSIIMWMPRKIRSFIKYVVRSK